MAVANDLSQVLASVQATPTGPTLRALFTERDRLTRDTGHYYGVTELTLRDADPIKYERFYNKLHAAVLAARESARFVAASPGSREMGECLWGITTPEGDTLAVSLGFLSHTAIFPVAVRYMANNDYDVNDGIEDGDVYAVSDGKTGGVPRSLLGKYDRIRTRRTHALYPLRGESCGNCDTAIPMQRRNQMVINGPIDVCEACGVLLYRAAGTA